MLQSLVPSFASICLPKSGRRGPESKLKLGALLHRLRERYRLRVVPAQRLSQREALPLPKKSKEEKGSPFCRQDLSSAGAQNNGLSNIE